MQVQKIYEAAARTQDEAAHPPWFNIVAFASPTGDFSPKDKQMGHLATASRQAGVDESQKDATNVHQRRLMTRFTPTRPFQMNSQAIVSWPYSGQERAENKHGNESGYLRLEKDDHVTILSSAEAGHTTNSFPFYVYCENTNGDHGWAPQLCLHRNGYGAFGVVSGLQHNTELNNTLVHVVGERDDGRVVGETTGSRAIAMPPACVRILDFKEDVEKIQRRGKSILLAP